MRVGEGRWPRSVLVTGGCGYVGSAVVPYLLRQPEIEHITVLDSLARGRLETIGYLLKRHRHRLHFQRVDLRQEEQVRAAFTAHTTPEAVVHLAATVDAPGSPDKDKRQLCDEVNADATLLLGHVAHELGVRCFVYYSSISVYGQAVNAVFTERTAPDPVTPYGKSKLAGERVLQYGGDQMAVIVLRPATIVGHAPGYRCEVVVNFFSLYAHFGVSLPIYRSAENEVRSYLAMEDAVESVGLALRNPSQFANENWNVATVNASLREIVETIRRIYPDARVDFIEGSANSRISFTVSAEKIRRAGFVPRGKLQTSFEQVRDYLDGVSLANQSWYESETNVASLGAAAPKRQ
jgi:UDP-glucose 4-epimerase